MKASPEREWYIRQTIKNGWSRNILVMQIETGLYRRQGKAQTNFANTLPPPQSDLAQQLLKLIFYTMSAEVVHSRLIAILKTA